MGRGGDPEGLKTDLHASATEPDTGTLGSGIQPVGSGSSRRNATAEPSKRMPALTSPCLSSWASCLCCSCESRRDRAQEFPKDLCGTGHNCSALSVPGPGTSTFHRCGKNKQTNKKKQLVQKPVSGHLSWHPSLVPSHTFYGASSTVILASAQWPQHNIS